MLPHRLGQRRVAQLSIEHRFELGVAPGDHIAHHHDADVVGDVFGVVPAKSFDLPRLQECAHRRIHVVVGALNVMALPLQQSRKGGHRRAADTDEMNLHATPPSSMTRRGVSVAMTRACTPMGSVIDGPAVRPDGNPKITGPLNALNSAASVSRASGFPLGSSHPTNSPRTTADARSRMPANRSCVSMRSRRYGRSSTSSRNSTWPFGGANA